MKKIISGLLAVFFLGAFVSEFSLVAAAVNEMKFDRASATIEAGKAFTLKVTANFTEDIKYGSSDISIATVDNNGKVTAKKEGVATIVAVGGNAAATCKVTVTAPKKTTPAKEKEPFNAETIAKNLVITPYTYTNSLKDPQVLLVIKNTSEYTLHIESLVETYDSKNNILSSKTSSERAVPSGATIVLSYYLDEAFAKCVYETTVAEEKYYSPVIQNFTYKSSSAENKEVISVTNKGSAAAMFAKAHVLFFKGNTLVGYDERYMMDNGNELKPGKTISGELRCYQDYDNIKVMFTGRG